MRATLKAENPPDSVTFSVIVTICRCVCHSTRELFVHFHYRTFHFEFPIFPRNILREFDNEVVPFQQVNTIEIVLVNLRSDIKTVLVNSLLDVTPILQQVDGAF